MGNRVSTAAALVTLAGLLTACSFTTDGLALRGVDEDGGAPARSGSSPPVGTSSVSESAPPVAIPPEAGAPVSLPADAGVAEPVTAPPATPPAMPPTTPPATPPPVLQVVRAHDVKTKRLVARIIHVHKLEARNGTAGMVFIEPSPVVDLELGPKNLEADELVVDTLYAHDVSAEHVEVGETHAAEVKIGKKGERGEN